MNFESDTRLCIIGSYWVEEDHALQIIRRYIEDLRPAIIISGQCHKGGTDQYAEEEAERQNIPFDPNPAKKKKWKGPGGFEERNKRMAEKCTHLLRIGSRRSLTYGSGWTADYAERIGKKVYREMVP